MSLERKKGSESLEGVSFLNQLIISLEEAELKLEQAYKKEKHEQVKAIKEFILKIQKKLEEAMI
jgi:predicted KAP-like P-loop ATPase